MFQTKMFHRLKIKKFKLTDTEENLEVHVSFMLMYLRIKK